MSRYVIGIDLGTTHCVVSYLDKSAEESVLSQQLLAIPQLTAPGSVESKTQLPSFLYIPHEAELAPADLTLPWQASANTYVVGELARQLGYKTPLRLVSSAKSWLSHSDVDPHSNFLPLEAAEEGIVAISPWLASKNYLTHLQAAWDLAFPEYAFIQQEIVITVPASFDPAARTLTAEAAQSLGIEQLTLLEEPQAALYSWIHAQQASWRQQVKVGDIILVVDVGGGTTDLSLIAVTEEAGQLGLTRIAVGDHILLGGDNMDLALAYRVQAKLTEAGHALQSWQLIALTQGCRAAKEQLLSDPSISSVPIVVPSRGSQLLGATLRSELTRDDVEQGLLEGFFPVCDIDDQPRNRARAALKKLGLPYAQEAAITRHLAAFLTRQKTAANELNHYVEDNNFIQPTHLLLNGGVFKSALFAQRLLDVMNGWLEKTDKKICLLDGAELDAAVAYGAAYYGYVRQGKGVRIRGGVASSYYVGVESALPAVPGFSPPLTLLCVAPFGLEEGSEIELTQHELGLVVGEPVEFKFFGSNTRRHDEAGILLETWGKEEIEELPEIQLILPVEGTRKPGDVVPVHLSSRVTEVGTLALLAISTHSPQQKWQVELNLRDEKKK